MICRLGEHARLQVRCSRSGFFSSQFFYVPDIRRTRLLGLGQSPLEKRPFNDSLRIGYRHDRSYARRCFLILFSMQTFVLETHCPRGHYLLTNGERNEYWDRHIKRCSHTPTSVVVHFIVGWLATFIQSSSRVDISGTSGNLPCSNSKMNFLYRQSSWRWR